MMTYYRYAYYVQESKYNAKNLSYHFSTLLVVLTLEIFRSNCKIYYSFEYEVHIGFEYYNILVFIISIFKFLIVHYNIGVIYNIAHNNY